MGASGVAPVLRARWLSATLTALPAALVVIGLAGGTGLPGLVATIPLVAVTAVFCVVAWLVLRARPHSRVRIPNVLRGLVAGVLVATAVTIFALGSALVGHLGDRGDLPIDDRYVCVVVCDGANLIQARDRLMKGLEEEPLYSTAMSRSFPSISHHFIQNGALTANGLSVWSSSSVPACTGIMTGCLPPRTDPAEDLCGRGPNRLECDFRSPDAGV